MKRAILAMFCCAALLAHAPAAFADPAADQAASDQDMANRYLRAAQSGNDDAEFYLGSLYSAGIGVPRSDPEAFRWISRAADQGHSHAMLIVAGLYATGRGVQKDNIQAYKWAYIVSVGSRVDEFRNGARQLMSVLATKMKADEISVATAEAGRWHATVVPTAPAPANTSPNTPLASTAPITAAAPVATAAPSTAPAPASSPQPPARTANNDTSSPRDAISKDLKNGDASGILNQVPQGLRRRFGF
jgi:Sel1 repeat-containing protein